MKRLHQSLNRLTLPPGLKQARFGGVHEKLLHLVQRVSNTDIPKCGHCEHRNSPIGRAGLQESRRRRVL